MTAASLIRAAGTVDCRPWPRHVLSQAAWFDMAHTLPSDPSLAFVALWADPTHVHALFEADEPLLASVPVEAGLYAALSPARPGAALFERMISDLWGHQAAHATDVRPWLDHGAWPTLRPLSDRPVPNVTAAPDREDPAPDSPDMQPVEGDPFDCGPLPPALAAPAYWRMTLAGSAVHRLEARLGWSHRGILALMRGKSPVNAARYAARIDGAATVAHSTAFARAIEAALATPPPPAAIALRELLLALERIAVGLHDLHAVAEALAQPFAAAAHAREKLLTACAALTGQRLMTDIVHPGGVAIDPAPALLAAMDDTLASLPGCRRTWPARGALSLSAALSLAIPGPFGRASGRLDPAAPNARLLTSGTLAARLQLRTAAIADDIEAARTFLANIPAGPTLAVLPHVAAEGLGLAQGPAGPVWHWVRLAPALDQTSVVAASFAAAPGWLHLPALEQAAYGADPADLPALAASFALRPPGLDL